MSLTDLVCHVSAHLDARESPGDHSVEADHISSMVQSSEDDIEYLAEFQPLELSGSLGHGGEILSESHLHQRLDRWLVNAHQCLSFMEAFVTHLDRLGSNHQPLLVSLKEDENDGISRPFRFINAWQSHPDFHGFLETIKGIDRALLRRHSNSLVVLMENLKLELEEVMSQEESLWRQEACANWAIHGH
ncbi:hypothetical protein V6N12_058081 [Hibiscus sabdariffa]|uniref:Uncharacterized protein n=1 Tax=Hibiscus sabdariffa TaxID=183260 RepID=A0ABR2BP50_9ROSI